MSNPIPKLSNPIPKLFNGNWLSAGYDSELKAETGLDWNGVEFYLATERPTGVVWTTAQMQETFPDDMEVILAHLH